MKIKDFYGYIFMGLIFTLIPLFIKNGYVIHILSMFFVFSMLTIGLNLITGVAGQFSIGHAGFYGVGAYIAALIATKTGATPYLLELILSAVGASIFATFVAFSCIRVNGDYLAIVTLGSAEVFRLVCVNWSSVTGGPMGIAGIPYPRMFSFNIDNGVKFYYLGLIYFFIIVILCNLILNSKYGRAFRAIKEDEVAAASMAIPVLKYKVLVFAIGAFFAGIAGNYVVHLLMFVSPDNFTLGESIFLVEAVILGGLGSLTGSFVGAGLMLFLTELLRVASAAWRMLIIAVLIIIVMIKMPEGIMGKNNINLIQKWFRKVFLNEASK